MTQKELYTILSAIRLAAIEHKSNHFSGWAEFIESAEANAEAAQLHLDQHNGTCDDCGRPSRLKRKSDHHGGLKDVCVNRDACNERTALR